MTHKPRKGDKFWDQSRHDRGLQPNGYIIAVWKNDGQTSVTVKFHDTKGNEQYKDYFIADIAENYRNEEMGWMLFAD